MSNHDQNNRHDDQYESYAQYGGQNAYQDNRYDDQRSEKAFEIELASAGQLKQYRYTFDSLGNVTAEQERKGNGYWKSERIDADEHFSTVQLQGVSYLVKTESSDDGIEFQLLRDDNRDGVWTQIAEGETMGLYIDSVTGTIDLVGIQNYLAPVDVIIG